VCGHETLALPQLCFTPIANESRYACQHIEEECSDASFDPNYQKDSASQMRVEWLPMRGRYSAMLHAVIAASRYIQPYILLGRLQTNWSLGQGTTGGEKCQVSGLKQAANHSTPYPLSHCKWQREPRGMTLRDPKQVVEMGNDACELQPPAKAQQTRRLCARACLHASSFRFRPLSQRRCFLHCDSHSHLW